MTSLPRAVHKLTLTATVALGVLLFVGSVYALAGTGRIDMIDGQYRFEVSRNLVHSGSLQVLDPALMATEGIHGRYAPYGVGASLAGAPLIAFADRIGAPSVDREQFFFSFASAIGGASVAALLYLFYLSLGISGSRAIAWTLVSAFATLVFPVATSVFDQAQHAFFLLLACWLAFLGATRDSMLLTVAGGCSLAILANFQQSYALVFPTVALATLTPSTSGSASWRRPMARFIVFGCVASLGLVVWGALNYVRFGHPLISGNSEYHPPVFGNPLSGLLTLLFSPGKGLYLYSPTIFIALIGIRRLIHQQRFLGFAIVSTSLVYLGLISSLSFSGGDWSWGPRYFVSVLPLLALGFPFVPVVTATDKKAVQILVSAGVVVQLLALSIDHHRFFYARSLPSFFWYRNEAFYFHHSALFARPGEIWESVREGVPPEATTFNSGPHPELLTYAVFGPGPDVPPEAIPDWMRHYSVFWLPRPWPLWMRYVPSPQRPVNLGVAVSSLAGIGVIGLFAIAFGLRSEQ